MRILMLEDNSELSELVARYLSQHFVIDVLKTAEEASDYIDQFFYDVVLLDRDIDGEDVGMSLIPKIKAKNSDTGIIVISAYGSIADKISGLNLGADDYLDKPFDNDELLARIEALARRHQSSLEINLNGLMCNTSMKQLHFNGAIVPLTRKESDLFFYLLKKRGAIVSKEELLDALYLNQQNISSNTIDVTIGHIRKKLPIKVITTIKTRGYTIA